MTKTKYATHMTYSQISWQGFSSGVFLTYGYSLMVFLYLAIRLATSVVGVEEPPHLFKTVLLLVMSLLLTILMVAVVMSLIAGFSGALTAILALWFTQWLPYHKALAGVICILVVVIHGVIFATSGASLLTTHLPTYLFWIGIPTIVYLVFGIIAGNHIYNDSGIYRKT